MTDLQSLIEAQLTPEHYWTLREAVELCTVLEFVAPNFGAHVALTGGLLYKDGPRKDCDVVLYRIRQVGSIDWKGLWRAFALVGVEFGKDHGWCKKASFRGKAIDFFDPEADEGEYPV